MVCTLDNAITDLRQLKAAPDESNRRLLEDIKILTLGEHQPQDQNIGTVVQVNVYSDSSAAATSGEIYLSRRAQRAAKATPWEVHRSSGRRKAPSQPRLQHASPCAG